MDIVSSPFFWSTVFFFVVSVVLGIRLYQIIKKFNEIKIRDRLSNALEWPYIEEQARLMVKHCRRYQEKASFLMVDGDGFRKIFDEYGPAAGNEALTLLGQSVKKVVREVDLFGKYASGKFIVCLPNTDLNGSVVVAERIRQAITELRPTKYPLVYTVSIGCAQLHADENMEHVVERANQALERARESGGNRVSSSKNVEARSRRNSVWPNLQNLN